MDRRAFCGGIGLLPAALATGQSLAAGTPSAGGRDLEIWMRLAGALDDRLVIWWMEGVRYGVVDAVSQPLYGMKVALFQRYFPQADGSWKLAMFELTYYSDLETGALLETWRNPYTGETNRVRHVRLGPEVRLQNALGQQADPDDAVVQAMLHDYSTSLGPALDNGDWLSISTSVNGRIQFPGGKVPDIVLNHYTTAMGNRSEALDSQRLSAPCSLAFQNVLRWEPWMQMQGMAGHMMSQASGRKLEAVSELPETYLAMAQAVHPKLIRDPLQTLAKPVAKILALS